MEGIPLKPLFSTEDRILRKFMALHKSTELKKTLVTALGLSDAGLVKVKESLQDYANSLFFMEGSDTPAASSEPAVDDREMAMREEYEMMKTLRPQIKMSKDRSHIIAYFSEPPKEP